MLLLCPRCDTHLDKCKKSTLKYGEEIYRCNGCGTYYLYNSEDRKLTVYDLEARVEEDIFKVVRENCGKELNRAQTEAFNRFEEALKGGGKVKGIISLPTGVGKTLLAACIIRDLIKNKRVMEGQHILVLAPRLVIQEQITYLRSDFNNIFRDLPVFVNMVSGKKAKHLIKLLKEKKTQIIVASPQLINLFELDKSTAVNTLIKAVILDEVHHTYNGPNISRTIRSIVENSDFVIGLSATPTKEAVENIGKILYYYSIKDAMKEGMLVGNIKFYKYDTIIEKAKYVDTGKECEDP
jgi:superfamily II DNA or RNA helicase